MKKILALALAATTAFSMFGSSLSASAIDYLDETAFLNDYNATSVTISANKITVTQPVVDANGTVTANNTAAFLKAFSLPKLVFFIHFPPSLSTAVLHFPF